MASVNRATLLGRLGKDPDVRFTAEGEAVANFSVAINRRWKDKHTGETKEHTEWVNVVAWGQLAQTCGQYLEKGSQVYVEGPLQTQQYDRDGVRCYSTKVRAMSVQFLSRSSNGAGGDPYAEAPASQAPLPVDDDIPF